MINVKLNDIGDFYLYLANDFVKFFLRFFLRGMIIFTLDDSGEDPFPGTEQTRGG
jgi:hypothetical protein